MDVAIDDSRARKVLGYRNKFSNAHTVSARNPRAAVMVANPALR